MSVGPIPTGAIAGAMRALRHPDFESSSDGIAIAEVEALEKALGITLPDDVLALMVCGARAIHGACGLRFEEAAEWNKALHDVQCAPEHLVGLGYLCDTEDGRAFWTTEPEGEREWSTYHSYVVCIARDAPREGPTTVVLWPQFENERETFSRPLADLVRDNLAARYGKLAETGACYEPALFEPSLPARSRSPARRARHPKFGDGTIIEERDDHLTIDFGAHGLKRLKASFVVLLAMMLALSCDSGPPPPFYVKDGFLRDSDGRAVILHGANVSGKNKYSPYLDFQQAPDIARMRDEWGMNGMRLVVTWAAIEPQRGIFDDAFIDRLADRVTWAEDAGILVIVDMHQDLYGEGFEKGGGDGAPLWTCDQSKYDAFVPTDPWFFGSLDPNVESCFDAFYADPTEFVAAWKHLAQRLVVHANIVGFDPLNEPSWGSYSINNFEADILAGFYEKVVAAVRSEAPNWVAFVEPSSSRNLGYPTGLPKFDYPNVVYAPHSYDRNAEQGQAYDGSHRADIMANAASLRAEATSLGAALWIGEYGGPSTLSGIETYVQDELDAIDSVAGGATYWDYSDGGYGLLSATPGEMTTITRPYPQRVAGDSVQYAWDAGKHALTLTYAPKGSAPTLISVAPAFRPVASVDCGGCTFDFAEPGVRILTPPSGTVTIQTK